MRTFNDVWLRLEFQILILLVILLRLRLPKPSIWAMGVLVNLLGDLFVQGSPVCIVIFRWSFYWS